MRTRIQRIREQGALPAKHIVSVLALGLPLTVISSIIVLQSTG
ncbi:MAG TPA: hypothetical protein VKW06_21740 [Candidatus Angelobacter sp.]|nr:hypothetical protein [Candidatus Angelobacter sp.]